MLGTSKQPRQTTLIGSTVFPGATVTVTDPAHPLYGLTFALAEVANKPQIGRACVVWLQPGVARLITVSTQLQPNQNESLTFTIPVSLRGIGGP